MAMANGERRDIERGLHDGVQQDLVALAVNLQLAEELAGSDPAALKALLAEMRRDVRDAIEGVRALARDVYPPLLADLGLADALRGAASGVRIPVRIEADGDRYPSNIEATVYFACLEILETMTGAKPAGRATLRVWTQGESLLFEVTLEGGPGSSALDSVRRGVEDRIGAVGGSMTFAAESKGMRIRGTIPLDDAAGATDPRPGRGSPP